MASFEISSCYMLIRTGEGTWPGPRALSRMYWAWDRASWRDLPSAGGGKDGARGPCPLCLLASPPFLLLSPPPDLDPKISPCPLAPVWSQKI